LRHLSIKPVMRGNAQDYDLCAKLTCTIFAVFGQFLPNPLRSGSRMIDLTFLVIYNF
jgi:hypothetical protein